ncbi:MAG: glycosyltransferase [candidate division Zixibacteria bacterium]|nr:glycosyltransferase [candidate division Zixibacteria bacterium]
MKVLWIKSDFLLPADTGGKIRSKCLLFELAEHCQITYLSYAPPDLEKRWFEEMQQAGITPVVVPRAEERKAGLRFLLRVLSKITSTKPYIVNKYITAAMRQQIRSLLEQQRFDVVVCDFLEMAWCADLLNDLPHVLFEHNVETMIWRRYCEVDTNLFKKLYFAREKKRMERFEREACANFDLVLTVSEQDNQLLRDSFDLKRSLTIPTGVDIVYFQPRQGEIDNRLVFSGSMDWLPNIDAFWWFYRSIFPLISKDTNDISLTVVGRRPPEDIVAAGRQDQSVEITGTVADIRPHVASGQLFVLPLRIGGGTRIKIYEAMAMKKCVLSTTIGAEGLPVTDGVDIVLADTEKQFAGKVRELLHDDNKRNRIAAAGYRLVTENYSWRQAALILQQGLQSVVAGS